jgi:hypothetical protein
MVLSDNQTAEIKGAIASALERVYSNDLSLIERRAHERSIAFRFGLYFSATIAQTSFGKDIQLIIDLEYNRNQNNVKNMAGFNPRHGVFPDVILHHRGFNDKNIVVIEFKGYWNDQGGDDAKLRGFTHQQENDYHYGLGVFIQLREALNECLFKYYKNGELEEE